MAKHKPVLARERMEEELGYSVATPREGILGRLYSDLRPVSINIHDRTEREFLLKHSSGHAKGSAADMPLKAGDKQTFEHRAARLTLEHTMAEGSYRFLVDAQFDCGPHLSFLFAEAEVSKTLFTSKVLLGATKDASHSAAQHTAVLPMPTTKPTTASRFFKLPRELRDKIYMLAIPEGIWTIQDLDAFSQDGFARALGDPTGFLFPLSKQLGVLAANKQMRLESLPLAYRRTLFCLDDLDGLAIALLAVGCIGRDNIEAIRVPWESRSDTEAKWERDAGFMGNYPSLPALNVQACVQLLRKCGRLRSSSIHFEEDLLTSMSEEVFQGDPGIQELISLSILGHVDVRSMGDESLSSQPLAEWLRAQITTKKAKLDSFEHARV